MPAPRRQEQRIAVGPAKLRIGGYVGVTGIYRSTSSGGGPGTNFGTIPYEDTLAGSVSETRLTAQSSRLSIRVDAPFTEARFRNISGYFEMDFNGATPGTIAVTSNSAGFRLRQGFADVQYGDHFSMAVGQAFTLMTPAKARLSVWPSDYEMSQAVDTNYLVGMVWERVPQVRFTWRASDTIDWAVSIENPEQQIGECRRHAARLLPRGHRGPVQHRQRGVVGAEPDARLRDARGHQPEQGVARRRRRRLARVPPHARAV